MFRSINNSDYMKFCVYFFRSSIVTNMEHNNRSKNKFLIEFNLIKDSFIKNNKQKRLYEIKKCQ